MPDLTITLVLNTTQAAVDIAADFRGYKDQIEDQNGNMISNPQSKLDYILGKGHTFLKDYFKRPAVVLTKLSKDSTRKAEDIADDALIDADVDSRMTLTVTSS